MAHTFNYISFGSREYIEDGLGEVSMSRSRMFEYTPADIRSRLEALDSSAVAYLEQQPTFLCSEITRDGKRASMVVQYGWIEPITVSRKSVETEFHIDLDFGEVEFPDVDAANAVFETDPFQMFRTHWAVREGDAVAVLERLKAYKAPRERGGHAERPMVQAVEAPEVPKRQLLGEVDSVEAFLSELFKVPAKPATETFFRGHDDLTYQLAPSLLRTRDDGGYVYLPNEDRLCKELLIAHYDEFQGDQFCFDRLVRMQHYELPTRLLDISGNPLVALFFACSPGRAGGDLDAPGEVILFRIPSRRVKYYDSDTVSCLANLCNLSHEQKDKLRLDGELEAFNEREIVKKLLHHIKSEKPYFEGRIQPEHLGSILCVKAKRTNTRIKSQSGAFLLFGHDAKLSEDGMDGIEVDRIRVTDKREILKQLDRLNINATTVYPSIDRTALHLKDVYKTITEEGPAADGDVR